MIRKTSLSLFFMLMAGTIAYALTTVPMVTGSFGLEPSTTAFKDITAAYVGDWKQYGEVFTNWQSGLFKNIYGIVVVLVPAIFLLHYLIFGAKKFSHDGPGVYIFGVFSRINHWIAAIAFTLLVVTGLMIVFGNFLGGGQLLRFARSVHIVSALVSAITAIPMFLIWVKDMFPAPHDIAWLFIMGGYLSKEKKPVPAGKFNAGQKAWFWLCTAGTLVMAYTGYILFAFQGETDQIRLMAIIHNFLGAVLVAFFTTHFYMAVFAIKGAIDSMISGYKPKEEIEILHSRYKISE